MTKREAHALLNAAIAGVDVSSREINWALLLTGDFDPCRSTAETFEIPSDELEEA